MTESCGMCAILPPELMSYGNVGLPVPCVEIKFLDVPDAGYLSTNNPPPRARCARPQSPGELPCNLSVCNLSAKTLAMVQDNIEELFTFVSIILVGYFTSEIEMLIKTTEKINGN